MDNKRKFNKKRTVKVRGVRQFLLDQIEKEFQSKGNSTGYADDVNNLHVCPNGDDYILVEFVNDISDPKLFGKTLKIDGTHLKVEKWQPLTVSTENVESGNDNSSADRGRAGNSIGGEAAEGSSKDRKDNANQGRHGSDRKPEAKRLFQETNVTLSDDVAKQIEKDPELKKFLEDKKIKLEKGALKGTWNSIFAAGRQLISYIPGFDFIGNYSEQESKSSSQSSEEDNTPKADQSGRSIKPDESFSVNPLFLRYIIAYHYEEYQKLENVSREISFEISETASDRSLKIFACKDVDRNTFSKTVDKFIDFYQDQNQKMVQEIIPKKNKDLVLEARARFSVVINSARDKKKMVIYGEKENVQKALKFLGSKVADSTASTASSSSTLNDAASGSSSRTYSGHLPSPEGGTGKKVTIEKLSCVLFNNLKVSVYQADLTKETADVIVNPANERLKHDGGAAGAIVKAGGKIIQDECDEIMKRRNRTLNPGEVETTYAGNLPCNFIIHAVGPRWSDYRYHEKDTAKNVLYGAVLNCLTCASHYAATSISIPAISSGIFGVPVKICAEVLFLAATNFAKNAPKSNSLKEIRFVNIDKTTTQIFVQEMKKRFGASIRQESVEIYHSKSDKANNPADQQHQLIGAWRENPMNSAKGAGSATTNRTLVSYTEEHSSPGNDNKGSGVGNSHLNANALPFKDNHFSAQPSSYSDAVAGKRTKEPDKLPAPLVPVDNKEDECSICLCDMKDKKTLPKCGHSFCAGCIDEAFKHNKKCPICSTVYGALKGNQPQGNMYDSWRSTSLPGFGSCGTITISYRFPNGTQGPEHPHPGKPYTGTSREAFLPDNKEGKKVLRLLKKAFEQKVTFTIGQSVTTGRDDCVIWNDIHHKTTTTGGPTNFGYPDPTYLKRVQEELAAKGITE